MPESAIRTHLRLVRAGLNPDSAWGLKRKAVPEESIVLIGRANPAAGHDRGTPDKETPASAPPKESAIRSHLRLLTGGLRDGVWGRSRLSVPRESIVLIGRALPGVRRGLTRKHILMLALAAELVCLGFVFGRDHSTKGIMVDEPDLVGNIVT